MEGRCCAAGRGVGGDARIVIRGGAINCEPWHTTRVRWIQLLVALLVFLVPARCCSFSFVLCWSAHLGRKRLRYVSEVSVRVRGFVCVSVVCGRLDDWVDWM